MGATFDKVKGKLKKAEGEVTGDKLREAQGWAEEKKGEIEGAIDRAADRVDSKIDEARREREEREEREVGRAHDTPRRNP